MCELVSINVEVIYSSNFSDGEAMDLVPFFEVVSLSILASGEVHSHSVLLSLTR